MAGYEGVNDILVKLFHDIMDKEAKVVITDEFKDISNNDMHVLEAVGRGEPKNMSSVAKELSVTVGTLTIAMNSLVKKGYVERRRSDFDRRVVLISLTEKGTHAYEHHRQFHQEMVEGMLHGMDEAESQVLVKALTNLSNFYRSYGK